MRAILVCGGRETRWNNYLGVPKQLAPVPDEPLLHRTVRQLHDHGVTDVHVVGPDDRFKIQGSTLHSDINLWPTGTDIDKFLSSKFLWNPTGRTLIVYGDVYFTENAISTVINHSDHEWKLFCRFGPNDRKGQPQGGECFVQ